MRLWRTSNHASLSGDGGLYASGRWHLRGRRVVYLADHPASALVEIMVHLEIDAEDLPTHYQLLGVEVPNDVNVTPLLENSIPTLEVPLAVRPPKLIDQLLPITGTEPRSASKTTIDWAAAIIASDHAPDAS